MKTFWAVMRRDDKEARALFTSEDDAIFFAMQLPLDHPNMGTWKVYPWGLAADTFDCE